MNVLLVNSASVVSRLLSLCIRNDDIYFEEVSDVHIANRDEYDVIFVDEASYSDKMQDRLEQLKANKRVYLTSNQEESVNSFFNKTIIKPFLPIQIKEILKGSAKPETDNKTNDSENPESSVPMQMHDFIKATEKNRVSGKHNEPSSHTLSQKESKPFTEQKVETQEKKQQNETLTPPLVKKDDTKGEVEKIIENHTKEAQKTLKNDSIKETKEMGILARISQEIFRFRNATNQENQMVTTKTDMSNIDPHKPVGEKIQSSDIKKQKVKTLLTKVDPHKPIEQNSQSNDTKKQNSAKVKTDTSAIDPHKPIGSKQVQTKVETLLSQIDPHKSIEDSQTRKEQKLALDNAVTKRLAVEDIVNVGEAKTTQPQNDEDEIRIFDTKETTSGSSNILNKQEIDKIKTLLNEEVSSTPTQNYKEEHKVQLIKEQLQNEGLEIVEEEEILEDLEAENEDKVFDTLEKKLLKKKSKKKKQAKQKKHETKTKKVKNTIKLEGSELDMSLLEGLTNMKEKKLKKLLKDLDIHVRIQFEERD